MSRQRLIVNDKTVLERGKRLSDYALKSGDVVILKDLGPQISWTTVFIIEYLGPLLIHPFFYYNQELIYGQSAPKTIVQQFSYCSMMIHSHFFH